MVQLSNGFLSQVTVSLIFMNMQMMYSFHKGHQDERAGQILRAGEILHSTKVV